eukprot:TRINITY_DN22292_c0_g1_i1.p1 TRINITY_DN22292_c0_g1~~TRINITY_DN22292_c0_g1_i1.p1  ORF type:complete len:650 (-),score=140.70 TRINITY_DN22292_c0_g1_i1:36-1985(-)
MGGQDDALMDMAGPLSDIYSVFQDPVWAEVYAAVCCDAGEGLTPEAAQSFRDAMTAQNPASAPERLSLRCLRFGTAALSCLAMQMKDRSYTSVDLSDNQFGDHSILAVRSFVRALPRLRCLVLAGNLIGVDGARELAMELESNTMLERLALGGSEAAGRRGFWTNSIGADGLKAILEALVRNPRHSLTSLTLCNTSLGAHAGTHLANFLQHDSTLLHLDVSSNPLTSEGVCNLVPHTQRLRILDISDTGCRGELIFPPLCSALPQSKCLAHLGLAHNPLEPRALRRLVRAFAACDSLVSLSLERTSLGTESVTLLADALLAAPVQSLTELDLSDNQLSELEACTALAHAISGSLLQVLRLNRNPVGDSGVRELADSLDPAVCANGCLRQLELCTCRVGTDGASELFRRLKNNEHLRCLRLSDNFIDDSMDISLVEQLSCLQELQITGNRLAHSTLQRASQVCARNRRRARDKEPMALRAEMHRLLYQETKLAELRERVAADEVDISARHAAAEKTRREMQQMCDSERGQQEHLRREIFEEEEALEARRTELQDTNRELEASNLHYAQLHKQLRETLQEREQRLAHLQALSRQLHDDFEHLKQEHPEQVRRTKERTASAAEETTALLEGAEGVRKQLREVQDRSLVGFQP